MPRVRHVVRLSLALAIVAAVALGAPTPRKPEAQKASPRLVALFDFEERDEGNYEQLPRNWLNIVDTGFPQHTADRTGFDTAHAVSGEHALRLQSDGGSAALVLRRGVIAAVPGAAYRLKANVRTDEADEARARIVAYLVDDHGKRIDGGRAASDLVVSDGRWRAVSVDLTGRHPDAAWVILRLELVQPEQFKAPRLGDHTIHRQDIGATAWFDDLALIQVPRLELSTASETQIIRAPDRPHIDAVVEDFAGDDLVATLTVHDHDGRRIDRQRRPLTGRQPPRWRWEPDLERFGWYLVTLDVRNAEGPVGRRRLGLCWLPAQATMAASPRLGLNADRLDAALRPILPTALGEIGAGSVIVPIWQPDDRRIAIDRLLSGEDPLLKRLAADRREVTAAFAGVPAELAEAANVDADRPLSLFASDPEHWQGHVERYAAELATLVDRWQVGATNSFAAAQRRNGVEGYRAARRVLGRLTAGNATILPWPAEATVSEGAVDADALLIRIPVEVRPGHLTDYARGWSAAGDKASLALATLGADYFDHDARAADLTHRLLEAWATEAPRVYVDLPWRAGSEAGADGGRTTDAPSPDPLAAALSMLHDRVAGREVVARLDLAPDVPAWILEGPRGGAMVVWSQSPDARDTTLSMRLGEEPRAFDVWGNPVELSETEGRHRFTVGQTPLFIEPIDAKLARFRAGLRLTPALVESENREHKLTLSVTNPWPHGLAGTLRFDPPDRWSISPRQVAVSIEPGQTVEREIAVRFPLSETGGRKLIPVHATLESEQQHGVELYLPLEIGLKDIEFEPYLNVERRGDRRDVKLTLIVTNHGTEPRSFYAFAMGREEPSRQRIISRLAPGQTIIKRITMPDAGNALSGEQVRVGLREMDGPAILSRMLKVP